MHKLSDPDLRLRLQSLNHSSHDNGLIQIGKIGVKINVPRKERIAAMRPVTGKDQLIGEWSRPTLSTARDLLPSFLFARLQLKFFKRLISYREERQA